MDFTGFNEAFNHWHQLQRIWDQSGAASFPASRPSVINAGGVLPVGTPTPWNDVTGALAHAPMFAKADPRSIRYNSMIGVVNVTQSTAAV